MSHDANFIVFLQNAWSPVYAGGQWPRGQWIRALVRSRSGQRLSVLLGDDWQRCHNTTPIVGGNPNSVVPPDAKHIESILDSSKPVVVVTCGIQAREAVGKLWRGPMLAVPHPASRVLTDRLYQFAKHLLGTHFNARLSLVQRRGGIGVEELILGNAT